MELPLTSSGTQEKDIKEQFKEGPAQEPQVARVPTQQEMDDYRDRMMKQFKHELPYLRMAEEYESLLMKAMERDVLLGRRPANTVPGPLGMELMLKDLHLKADLANFKAAYEQAEEEQNRKNNMAPVKESSSSSEESNSQENTIVPEGITG